MKTYDEFQTDTEYELYQKAYDWYYDQCHGYAEDIIKSLAELLASVKEQYENS